jgi:hypothetical protein
MCALIIVLHVLNVHPCSRWAADLVVYQDSESQTLFLRPRHHSANDTLDDRSQATGEVGFCVSRRR